MNNLTEKRKTIEQWKELIEKKRAEAREQAIKKDTPKPSNSSNKGKITRDDI